MLPKIKKLISLCLVLLFLFQQSGFAQVAGELDIAGYLSNLHNALTIDKFRPLHLRYLAYDTLNNNFKVLLDKGDLKALKVPQVEQATQQLLEYFFVGVSLPNDKFWVNLRPDSPDNIIDLYLAQTDVGKILLEADLQLKKDTAKFTSPENPKGKEYWDKLYKKAGELFGYDNITIPTLTRPWIVPDEIIISETAGEASGTERSRSAPSAYIYKATLKVMLEQDYLQSHSVIASPEGDAVIASEAKQSLYNVYSFKDPRLKELNEYSTQLIRELIIPKLTKEVNSSKRYASLRQVYYSLIMAQWFKARFNQPSSLRATEGSEAISSRINSSNLTNLVSKNPWSKTTYFKQYQKSFKDGEYNISEPVYTPYGQTIRSYFSGGMVIASPDLDKALTSGFPVGNKAVFPTDKFRNLKPNEIIAEMRSDNEIKIRTVSSALKQEQKESTASSEMDEEVSLFDAFAHSTFNKRLVVLYQLFSNKCLDTRTRSKKYMPLVIIDVGIGENGAPTIFNLANILKFYGYSNVTIYGIDNYEKTIQMANKLLELNKEKLGEGIKIKFILGDIGEMDKMIGLSEAKPNVIFAANILRYRDTKERERDIIRMRGMLDKNGFLFTANGPDFVDRGFLGGPQDTYIQVYEKEEENPVFFKQFEGKDFGAAWQWYDDIEKELGKEGMDTDFPRGNEHVPKGDKPFTASSSAIKNANGIDGYTDSVSIPQQQKTGGIDFRSLPIVTQAVTNLSANISSSAIHNLISINLNEEWQQIERMANSGITPSSERIKEYIQTSLAQDTITQDRDKILLCISGILRQEEERCDHTNPTLRDILVVLESMRNAQELRQVFLGTIS